MIDCITIEHDQLKGAGQLEDALDLLLHLAEAVTSAGGALHDGTLRGIVHDGALGQRNVGHNPGDDDPALEAVLEEVEEGLLHHVRYLVSFQAGSHKDNGSHRGYHIVGTGRLLFLEERFALLLVRRRRQRSLAMSSWSHGI